MKWNKRIAVWAMAGALGCASVAAPALTAQAQEQQIVLSQNVLNLAAGGSQNVLVDYSNVAGGFADLGVADRMQLMCRRYWQMPETDRRY